MREIKFRAWDIDSEVFLNPTEILIRAFNGAILRWDKSLLFNIEIQQFTGLQDKNGKDIYEGDILRFNGNVYEIKFNQLHCGWGLFQNGGMKKELMADWINNDGSTPKQWENKEIEVIGNIFENPELLTN